MKKEYLTPSAEEVSLDSKDVISTSDSGKDNEYGYGQL